MSRHAEMSPRARRAWGIGLVAFFVVLFGMVAWSQWYAIHVNVPRYEAQQRAALPAPSPQPS
ncbi:MAG: hypothetical protein ACYDA5_08485 [Vulcanimicrobiaceae bacterium]